jgi:exosome complex RNA-binding protein Rrp42 (RNase PH superfamily)
MGQKTDHRSFDQQRSLTIDYVLIATGVGAALIGLVYLLAT